MPATAAVAIGFLSDSLYALGSGMVGGWLQRRPAFARRQHRVTGALYLGLGVWVLASGPRAGSPSTRQLFATGTVARPPIEGAVAFMK